MKNVTLPKIFMPYYCSGIIRLGKDHDGGYLVNEKDVINSSWLLSFGIGEDVSFEEQFIKKNERCSVIAYDSTIGNEHDDFFTDRHKINRENISSSNINRVLCDYNNVFLKCDIDGSEYEILHDLIENSNRFTGVTIEFHGITNYNNFNDLTNFISKFDLRLIHVHINNYSYVVSNYTSFTPDVVELTFTSYRENTSLVKNIELPHRLDMTNNPRDDEFKISF
jgi:hypothetical protein